MTIDRWITNASLSHPDKIAIEFHDQSISYAALSSRIHKKVESLLSAGVSQGDRVAWYGLNHPDMFVLLFACARIGAIFVPINWRLAAAEIEAIVQSCQPSLIYHDKHFVEQANALATDTTIIIDHAAITDSQQKAATSINSNSPRINASVNDPVLLVYTSGSTGQPKGVLLAQTSLMSNARMSIHAYAMTAADKVLVVLPLFHVGGLNILPTPAFSIGASVVLMEKFEPEQACKALQECTLAITVPTVLSAILKTQQWASASFDSLRALSIGSTDVPISLIQQVHDRNIPIIQIYGATETGPFAIYQQINEAMSTVGSIGRAGCDCEIRLVSDDKDVETGQAGEIWVKGDNTLMRYWLDDELTSQSIKNGWFRTGDVAIKDNNGLYWFTDRIKHIIISGGENIYPTEIERILSQHPAITEVSVVGQADEKWGEIPVAVLVCKEPISEADILESLNGQLARYKHPKKLVFVESLPRNAMGKVVASEVKRLLA